MSVWDEAEKPVVEKGSVWDRAAVVETPPLIEPIPEEAYAQGRTILDWSMDFGVPIEDIEEHYPQLIAAPEESKLSRLFQRYIRDPITEKTGLFPYVTDFGDPRRSELTIPEQLSQWKTEFPAAFLHVAAERISGLGLSAPDVLAQEFDRYVLDSGVPVNTLAELVGKITGLDEKGEFEEAAQITGKLFKFLGGMKTAKKLLGPLMARLPVREGMRLMVGGGLTFATVATSEQIANSITKGEDIDWGEIHRSAGWGTIFGGAQSLVGKLMRYRDVKEVLKYEPRLKQVPESLLRKVAEAGQARAGGMTKKAWTKVYGEDMKKFVDHLRVIAETPLLPEKPVVPPVKPPTKAPVPPVEPTKPIVPAKPPTKPTPPPTVAKPAKPAVTPPKVTKPQEPTAKPPPDVTPKQIAEVAKKLPEAEISQTPTVVRGKKFYPVSLPTEKIGVDPKKFQFKLGAKLAGGVTEALKDVEAFDPVKAGQILVWQDKSGKYWVVDGHHRVALAKKTGAENLQTWVVREADGISAAEARAIGALRNLADGKGTAVDAAKLFRDSGITLKDLQKSGVPTNAVIVKQGMAMKNLSDYVFRLVVDEKLPANFAAPIGLHVRGDTQQRQVADLILEGEIDTVRQAELLAATIDTAPVLTTSEQTLFGLETTEKSLFAERAKVLANVEKKLKTNKKVFGTLATQTGIIEAKGNVLAKVENLMAKEQAEEVLFMLEKLANSKGPIAEALNDATKDYAKNPTKENLAKVTSKLLQQWTEGAGRLRIPGQEGIPKLPLERVGEKVAKEPVEALPPVSPRPLVNPHATALEQDKQRKAQQKWDKKHPGGKVDITPLVKVHDTFMSIIEPSKAVEIAQGKDVYAEVIKATHKADVAMIDFNEKELENLDMTLGEWGKALSKYSNRTLELLMLSRGKPASKSAILIRDEALEELAKKAPELVGTRKMITRASDFNYDYLAEVVGDQINYIEDYFYGIYKDPRKVEKFLDHWKTTKRFTKEKKLPTVADAKAFGLDLRDPNPVNNLRSEYLAIARLEGMIDLKTSLMKSGEGDYIANTADAPMDWDKVHDPVFADVRVAPELAKMINSLISTNRITRQPLLNTVRQVNNFLRTIKFVGSAFHLMVEAKQSLADSGYLGFLHKRTATRGLTTGFKAGDPIFKTPEYKDYIAHGGGHRYSIDSEAQRAFTNSIEKMGKAGGIAKGVALPFQLPEKFVRWMFENYIPKVKYSKYLDTAREQEVRLKRSLTAAEKIDIIKEQQNFYGMMNERLFGRSGTVTTLLRMKFMAPGFAEGNFRSMLKAVLQWGGDEGFSAHRSRANIINSFIISAIAATATTLILTGKPPKKPEKLSDIRDIFKADTGQVDQHGRPIMIDFLTYDKDYWEVFGNILTAQPAAAAETTLRRLGGMTATTWDVLSDLNQMSMGRAVYDWKGDRVVEVTDPFLQRILKISIHELKKAEPISTNVFQQARKKGVGVALSAAMTLGGVRLTKTEQDKKEVEILHKIFSLRDQQETLFWYLGTIKNPREHIKKYNQTVMRILDNPITPLEVKDEYEPKLIIDEKRLVSNKVYDFLGDKARLAEAVRSPKKREKDIKKLQDDIQRTGQWLRNFEVTERDYRSQIITYEELHRKITKEIQPEDDREALKKDLARFYADQTILKRKIQSGLGTDTDKRLARKYVVIGNNIAEVARRIYETEDEEKRDSLFDRIESAVARIKE